MKKYTMMKKYTKMASALAALTALMVTTACTSPNSEDAKSDAKSDADVVVCELAYYTGEWGSLGPAMTADIVFPVQEVINLDPPLGREWQLVHEDLGTVGEAQAARTCLEQHDADIMLSVAHGYRTYRDYMIEQWERNDAPLTPTVHGGAIPGNLGGKGAEPLFRAQGLDEGLGVSGVLHASDTGAKRIVIAATNAEGYQQAADAAEQAAELLGIEVVGRIDAAPAQSSYRSVSQSITDLNPDAIILLASGVDGATIIKQAAEAGASLNWIGETNWVQPEFVGTLGKGVIETQKSVGFAAFGHDESTPAWEFYSELWDSSPGFGDEFGDAADMYHFSTYDLMVLSALAVESAGSLKASEWAPAMQEVGVAPGEVCYTYADCLKLIRDGKEIDYEGITGDGSFDDGGVNQVRQAYTSFAEDGTMSEPIELDSDKALDLIAQVTTSAKCDPEDPPNRCEW